MELIDVIKSSLIIFFSFLSVTAVTSYITYRIKDRIREKPERSLRVQTEVVPVAGIYPRILSTGEIYKVPGRSVEQVSTRRLNIFRFYSFTGKMHKLRLSSQK